MKHDKFYNETHRVVFLSFFILLFSSWMFLACKSKNEGAENKNKETTVTQTTTVETSPTQEWVRFKTDAEKKIQTYQSRIAELKAKIAKHGTPNLDKMRKNKINELEKKIVALRTSIENAETQTVTVSTETIKTMQVQLDSLETELNGF